MNILSNIAPKIFCLALNEAKDEANKPKIASSFIIVTTFFCRRLCRYLHHCSQGVLLATPPTVPVISENPSPLAAGLIGLI